MLLGGVSMMALGAFAPSNGASPIPMAALGAVYIPFALLYVYPALKLWGYSSAIGRLLASRSSMDLEAAPSQQKSLWKFAGISTIVMIVLYGLFIVGAPSRASPARAAGSAHRQSFTRRASTVPAEWPPGERPAQARASRSRCAPACANRDVLRGRLRRARGGKRSRGAAGR